MVEKNRKVRKGEKRKKGKETRPFSIFFPFPPKKATITAIDGRPRKKREGRTEKIAAGRGEE